MARLDLSPDLDARIARTVGLRAVERLKRQVEDGAKERAPAAAVWLTMLDERVRASHADAHGQMIPGNLRFLLDKVVYVPQGSGGDPARRWQKIPGHDLARFPRDPTLPIEQRIHCRCRRVTVSGGVARTITSSPVEVVGALARAQVYTRFPRAAESEVGTSQDRGAHFMSGAVAEARARLHAR